MLALLGSLIGKIVAAAVVLILAAGGFVGFLYATDHAVDATVVDKSCAGSASKVTVQEKVTRVKHTVGVTADKCTVISKGNYVEYNLRSGHTRIYEFEGGRCLYDTRTGAICGVQAIFG